MHARHLGLVASLAFAACDQASGDPATTATAKGLPLTSLGAARTDAICGYLTRCCALDELQRELAAYASADPVTDLASCRAAVGFSEGFDQGVIADAVDRGRVTYNGELAQHCVDTIAALPCGGGLATAFGAGIAACTDYRRAEVADGGACAHALECQSLLCKSDPGEEGACVAPGGDGAWCPGVGPSACEAGFYCDAFTSLTCKRAQTSGTSDCTAISCGAGLSCQYDVCKPLVADGEPCAADSFCAGGTCAFDNAAGELRCAQACDGK